MPGRTCGIMHAPVDRIGSYPVHPVTLFHSYWVILDFVDATIHYKDNRSRGSGYDYYITSDLHPATTSVYNIAA